MACVGLPREKQIARLAHASAAEGAGDGGRALWRTIRVLQRLTRQAGGSRPVQLEGEDGEKEAVWCSGRWWRDPAATSRVWTIWHGSGEREATCSEVLAFEWGCARGKELRCGEGARAGSGGGEPGRHDEERR